MKLASNSSLRKLARAIARKEVPPERANIIEHALASAYRRQNKYLHSHERNRIAAKSAPDVLLTPPPLGHNER